MGMRARGLSNSLLYNYQYDQLNRLVAMDAWNRTGVAWSAITKVPDFKENISYDPNGNILGYKRNGNNSFAGKPLDMDSLGYKYIPGTNRLDHITDNVSSSNYPSDIDGQAAGNYKYDSIGQLISDAASGITNITWTVYGKIATISKSGDTLLAYTYDAGGNRVSKSVIHGTDTTTTWYVRDAQGNVLSVYTYGDPAVQGKDLTQTEAHIYGSSRLGILKLDRNVERDVPATTTNLHLLGVADSVKFTRGNKLFELTNHLGNVLVTISDKRYGVRTVDDTTAGYFIPDVMSANDYYPFGSLQPGRSYAQSGDHYRYGFNGKENDNEVKGEGNEIDYGMRVYDPRIGKFLSTDPLQEKYPELTPYQFASNGPVAHIDLDGLEKYHYTLTLDKDQPVLKLTGVEDYSMRMRVSQSWDKNGNIYSEYANVKNPYKEYDVTYSWDTYAITEVIAVQYQDHVTTDFDYDDPATLNIDNVVNKINEAVDNREAWGAIAQGFANGYGRSGGIAGRIKRSSSAGTESPSSKTNRTASAVHNGSEQAATANTATSTPASAVTPSNSKISNPVQLYEVGDYDDLQRRSPTGDKIDLHHFPQKQSAMQVIPGYKPKKGNSIAIDEKAHDKIRHNKGVFKGNARQLLAQDAKKVRKVGVPSNVVREAVIKAKKQYPSAYKKK